MQNRTVRLPESLLLALELLQEQEDRTVSDLIRRAVEDYCKRMLS